jgi:hypothetical protein
MLLGIMVVSAFLPKAKQAVWREIRDMALISQIRPF